MKSASLFEKEYRVLKLDIPRHGQLDLGVFLFTSEFSVVRLRISHTRLYAYAIHRTGHSTTFLLLEGTSCNTRGYYYHYEGSNSLCSHFRPARARRPTAWAFFDDLVVYSYLQEEFISINPSILCSSKVPKNERSELLTFPNMPSGGFNP